MEESCGKARVYQTLQRRYHQVCLRICHHLKKLDYRRRSRHRPNVVHLLYDRLPVQCKQCGIRFSESAADRKKLEDHLDMHFLQNRKANTSIGRGHSRSWFASLEVRPALPLLARRPGHLHPAPQDWVHDVSAKCKGKGHACQVTAEAALAAETAWRDAEL